MRKIKKIIFIVFIVFMILLTNSNTIYALSSKEEINRVRELIDENTEKELKKLNCKYARIYVSGGEIHTDSETGEQYPSTYAGSGTYSNDNESFKMLDICINTFKEEYMDKFLSENVKPEEKIIDYFISSYFPYTRENSFKEGDDIEFSISAFVFPEQEQTTWAKNKKKLYTGMYDYQEKKWEIVEGYQTEIYYVHLVYENEKYAIKYIDIKPEGYDDFVERMKTHGINLENMDYAKLINAKSEKEIISEVAEVQNFESPNLVIEKINVIIVIFFAILILITLFIYLKKLINK